MQTDEPILRASSGGRRGAGKPEVQLLGRLVSVFPVATVQLEFAVGTCPVLRLFSCSRERFLLTCLSLVDSTVGSLSPSP